MINQDPKVGFFFRQGNNVALNWADKIKRHIKKEHLLAIFNNKKPDVLIVLGGDGTILEAAKKYHHVSNPTIFGLNLGNVGYLASVRDPKDFINSITRFF